MHFESITKLEREAQKSLSEHPIWILSCVFNLFSNKCTQKVIKNDIFGVNGDQGSIHLIKTEAWRTSVAKPEGEHALNAKARGTRMEPPKTYRLNETKAGRARERNRGSQPGFHTGAAMTDSLKPNSLK